MQNSILIMAKKTGIQTSYSPRLLNKDLIETVKPERAEGWSEGGTVITMSNRQWYLVDRPFTDVIKALTGRGIDGQAVGLNEYQRVIGELGAPPVAQKALEAAAAGETPLFGDAADYAGDNGGQA